MKPNFTRGFTLIELLVVVAIIGILAAVGVVAYNGYTNSAKVSVSKSNHNTVVKKLNLLIQECHLSPNGKVKLKMSVYDKKEYEKEMQRQAREYEERKRLAEANNNTKSNSNLSGRERAKQVASYKAGGALKGFLGGLIGLAIGFGLYSIMDRKIKNKLNDKFFLGAAFFIGWIITKFI